MERYALLINVPGESPATYSAVYETETTHDRYLGTGDMEMAAAVMEELAAEGFGMVNLCGDFDDETVKKFIELGKNKVRVRAARYFPSEMAKLGELTSMSEYGFISQLPNLSRIERLELTSATCNTHVFLVPDLAAACEAAAELVKNGADLIELCSWFNDEKTRTVIDAIRGAVPVGSCGSDGTVL